MSILKIIKATEYLKKIRKADLSVKEIKALFTLASEALAELMSEYEQPQKK